MQHNRDLWGLFYFIYLSVYLKGVAHLFVTFERCHAEVHFTVCSVNYYGQVLAPYLLIAI